MGSSVQYVGELDRTITVSVRALHWLGEEIVYYRRLYNNNIIFVLEQEV